MDPDIVEIYMLGTQCTGISQFNLGFYLAQGDYQMIGTSLRGAAVNILYTILFYEKHSYNCFSFHSHLSSISANLIVVFFLTLGNKLQFGKST